MSIPGSLLALPQSRAYQVCILYASLWETLGACLYRSQGSAPHLPSAFRLLTTNHSSSLCYISSVSVMSQPSSSSFQGLFNAALQDYKNQTGTKLDDHPLAKELETCNSVESITTIIQNQAQKFRAFRGDDGKLMKSLKLSVDVLYPLSTSTVLGEGIGLVHPKSSIGVICS